MVGLNYLIEGFFSVQAEGKSTRTYEYYQKLLKHLLDYAQTQGWPDGINLIDAAKIRQFLSWIGTRSYQYSPGKNSKRQSPPSSLQHIYAAY